MSSTGSRNKRKSQRRSRGVGNKPGRHRSFDTAPAAALLQRTAAKHSGASHSLLCCDVAAKAGGGARHHPALAAGWRRTLVRGSILDGGEQLVSVHFLVEGEVLQERGDSDAESTAGAACCWHSLFCSCTPPVGKAPTTSTAVSAPAAARAARCARSAESGHAHAQACRLAARRCGTVR